MSCAVGLQANRQLPELATIEGVLEKAIFKAGLITEANFGDFRCALDSAGRSLHLQYART